MHFPWTHVPANIAAQVSASICACFALKGVYHPYLTAASPSLLTLPSGRPLPLSSSSLSFSCQQVTVQLTGSNIGSSGKRQGITSIYGCTWWRRHWVLFQAPVKLQESEGQPPRQTRSFRDRAG
ncbi:hypothetical protein PIB30_017865 [Stylosanthes scabra]|uniref:Uncharacterized protein n=1 Tax=Stylosanthes scabra TaxID=79078 RepID=A0ABU6X7P5_9FABA|nr:hypothetical protein [Stylosanthes scabra]